MATLDPYWRNQQSERQTQLNQAHLDAWNAMQAEEGLRELDEWRRRRQGTIEAAPPPSFTEKVRRGFTGLLDTAGMSPYMARRTSEGIFGRPFARPQSELGLIEEIGLAGILPHSAAALAGGEALTSAARGERGAALGYAGLGLLEASGAKGLNRSRKIKSPDLVEFPQSEQNRKYFQGILADAQDSQGPLGYQVSVYEPEAYKNMTMIASSGADGGFAITPEGEIVSLVKNKNSPMKGFAGRALKLAKDEGGVFLNAFDTELTNLYGKAGFKPVSRVDFDEEMFRGEIGDEAVDEFMEANRKFNDGRPDLVFMVRDPEFEPKAMSGQGGVRGEYDEAYDILRREMGRLGYLDTKKQDDLMRKETKNAIQGILERFYDQ